MFGSKSDLEKLTVQANGALEEIGRVEEALKTCETELAASEQRHKELLEAWQVDLALGKSAKRPAELGKLADTIVELRARRTGLKKRLASLCEGLTELSANYAVALKDRNQIIAGQLRAEIAAAKEALRQLQAKAVGLEPLLGLPEPLVPARERGERYEAPDGRDLYRDLQPIPPSDEDRAPGLLGRKLERYAAKAKSLRATLRQEEVPEGSEKAPGHDLALGVAWGRATATQPKQ